MRKRSNLESRLTGRGFDVVGEIKDAQDPISIFITQDDIDKGLPKNPFECTAAQCLQRAMGGSHVAMFLSTAYVQLPEDGDITRYIVPGKLRKGVVIPQDTGGTPLPGTYTLVPPKNTARLGQAAIRRADLALSRSQGLAPPPRKIKKKSDNHGFKDGGRWDPSIEMSQ